MKRLFPVLLAVALVATACGARASSALPSPSRPDSGSLSSPAGQSVHVHLTRIATLRDPVAMAVANGDPALYVAEQHAGQVVALRAGRVDPTPVLDLSGSISSGYERGILGLAFSPDARFMYVDFTDTNGDTHLAAIPFENGRADASRMRTILFVHQPFSNHNGGGIVFAPDGYLYAGLGDGGSEGDPNDQGQRLDTLLGKVLRIDPTPEDPNPYTVPSSNPLVGRTGARSGIWAYGLRNPWRFSFDRVTGDLWIGDVGQSAWEEIDFQAAGSRGGQNYGWSCFEGDHPFKSCRPARAIPPIHEYSHAATGGCAVVGGYVYGGSAIPGLDGAYVFGDNCDGRLVALVQRDGKVVQHWALGPRLEALSSFGEDQSGELYALSLSGALYRLVP